VKRFARRGFLLVVIAAAASTGLAGGAGAKEWWQQPLAAPPTDFIVGYGSLINTPSRNSTAKKSVPAIPVRVSAAFGYIRAWNSHADGFTAQGLRKPMPGEAPMTINGVLFAVGPDEMPGYDKRECRYHRAEVQRDQIEAAGWQGLPNSGRIWIYVPNEQASPGCQDKADPLTDKPDLEHPLLQSYIDVVVEGGIEYSDDFAREILETTADWQPFWLNDRELARRPWVHDPNTAKVDELLKGTLASDAVFGCRSFPEFYAARHNRASGKCAASAK
jgi:hypothetical protein